MASFRGARLWRGFVQSGSLDVVAGTLNQPVARRLLARCMAIM